MIHVLVLLSAFATGPATGGEQASASAAAARPVLQRCNAVDQQLASQPDSAWVTPSDAFHTHAALRSALGEAMPHAASMVLLYAIGGHLATEEDSIILERHQDGSWLGTEVGRSRIWIKDAPYTPQARRQWTLPTEAAQRLDEIIRDPCFQAEPTEFFGNSSQPPPLGAMAVNLDVVAPSGRRSSAFLGGYAKGLTAEIVQLSMPR